MSDPKHLVRTKSLVDGDYTLVRHPLNPASEEFLFVLEGRGVALIGDAEVEVGPGDYMGFPTDGTVHNLRNAGETDLVYLMGGERTATEVSRFPSVGKVAVFDRGQATFFDEASATTLSTEQWRPKR